MPATYANQSVSFPDNAGILAHQPMPPTGFGIAAEAFISGQYFPAPVSPAPADAWKICSYADIVADWITAERVSPSIGHIYHFIPEALRAKIRSNAGRNRKNYTADEIAGLKEALFHARGNLLGFYGIGPGLSFYRGAIPISALKKFKVIEPFIGPWKDLESFAAHETTTGKNGLKPAIDDMMAKLKAGHEPQGRPIALVPAEGPPILIEGYKRALFALKRGKPLLDIFFCVVNPPAARTAV